MKISILTPALSHNCLGRAYLLAKILQRHYEVEIAGPIFGEDIWKPVIDDKSITYKFIKIWGRFKPYWQIRELIKKIDGDVIYAHKPLFTSFGIGLLEKLRSRKPLILDIDDWQKGLIKEEYRRLNLVRRIGHLAYSTVFPYKVESYWNNLIGEVLVPYADAITVSNRFLKKRFGGTIIWHARDTKAFNPEKFDKNLARQKYGIEKNKKVVMFFGTPRPHKGVEELIQAISLLQDRDIILTLVGADEDNYSGNLIRLANERLDERVKVFGLQHFQNIPEFLIMSDVVVIPQRKNFATVGQVPAKVFDAMAMAKPIIATAVSDLPEILDGCGWIVESENPGQLAESIQYVLDNAEEAEEMGQKVRQKCIDKYSWDVMERILVGVFGKYER